MGNVGKRLRTEGTGLRLVRVFGCLECGLSVVKLNRNELRSCTIACLLVRASRVYQVLRRLSARGARAATGKSIGSSTQIMASFDAEHPVERAAAHKSCQ